MSQGKDNDIIAARLVRTPWWRTAWQRFGSGKKSRYSETLQRLAGRDVSDTVAEEDVKSWLAMLEGDTPQTTRDRRDP